MTNSLRWLWVCGSRDIVHGSVTVPFGSRWTELVRDVTAQTFRPPLFGRSVHEDVEHDETRAPIWGVLREWRVLSQEEAAAAGVEQSDEHALYGGFELTPAGQIADDAGQIVYCSPKVIWDPWYIEHLTACGYPAQRENQPNQRDLLEAALTGGSMAEEIVEAAVEAAEEAAEEAVEAAAEAAEAAESVTDADQRIKALEESVARILAALESREALADEDEGKDDEKDKESPASELRALRARVDRSEARARVASLRGAVKLPFSEEKAVALHMRDTALFEEIVASLPRIKHPATSQRVSVGGRSLSERESRRAAELRAKGHGAEESALLASREALDARARKLASSKGIPYSEAVRLAAAGGE